MNDFAGVTQWPDHCVEWSGKRTSDGYGLVPHAGRERYAHRRSYQVFKGEIPSGHHVHHVCCNRLCVNPNHLEAVTPRENYDYRRFRRNGNTGKTHCKYGHALSGQNLYIRSDGTRACRLCKKLRMRLYRLTCRIPNNCL